MATKKFEAPTIEKPKKFAAKSTTDVSVAPTKKATKNKAVKGTPTATKTPAGKKAPEKTERAPRASADAKVVLNTKTNPYREGSKNHKRFELLVAAGTVAGYLAACNKAKLEAYVPTSLRKLFTV